MEQSLLIRLAELGCAVEDLRSSLPVHASKRFPIREVAAILGPCIHHTGEEGGERRHVFRVAEYHVGANHISDSGCPGICYTLAIGRDGTVYLCNDLNRAVYAQGTRDVPGDENALFLGILTMGDFSSPGHPAGEPTLAQITSLLAVLSVLSELLGWSVAWWTGHFDYGKPSCPGSTIEGIIRAVRSHGERSAGAHGLDLATVTGRQQALKQLGYYKSKVDGSWGMGSKGALVAFQLHSSIPATGVWDPTTERAMVDALAHR